MDLQRLRERVRHWRISYTLFCQDIRDLVRRLQWVYKTKRYSLQETWHTGYKLLRGHIRPVELTWWGSHDGKVVCTFLAEIVEYVPAELIESNVDNCRVKLLTVERCQIYGETFGINIATTEFFDRSTIPDALNKDIDFLMSRDELVTAGGFFRGGWEYRI